MISTTCGQLCPHGLKGDVLVGLDVAAEPAGILLREKPFGNNYEQDAHWSTTVTSDQQEHEPGVTQGPARVIS